MTPMPLNRLSKDKRVMNKKEFDDLVTRLQYHNRGPGVADHCTANPIFDVQEKKRIYGIDLDYTDKTCVVDDDGDEWETPSAFYSDLDNEDQGEVDAKSKAHYAQPFDDLDDDERLEVLEHTGYDSLRIVGYTDEWQHVNTHLTREGAEAFIKRKQHDHKELRVYVESLYWCAEFKSLIEALLDGKITFKE